MLNLNQYGWDVHGIIEFVKEWCPICTRQRCHEIYRGWKICLACNERTEPLVLEKPLDLLNKECYE